MIITYFPLSGWEPVFLFWPRFDAQNRLVWGRARRRAARIIGIRTRLAPLSAVGYEYRARA